MSYSFLRQTSRVNIIGIIDHEKKSLLALQFQRRSREGGFYAGHANRITIGVMVWGKFKAQRRLVSESAILQMALIKALE